MGSALAIVAWIMMVHHHDGERRAVPPRPASIVDPLPEVEDE